MLKQTDILRAAQERLKKLYPLPVYLDEVKEDFQTPCFFLKLIKFRSYLGCHVLTDIFDPRIAGVGFIGYQKVQLNDCLLVITYFALKGTVQAVDLYDIKDSVAAAFWRGMKVCDRYIHFEEVRSDTDSEEQEIVYIQLPFQYYDSDGGEDEELPRIMKIYQSERIKGTQEYHCTPEGMEVETHEPTGNA